MLITEADKKKIIETQCVKDFIKCEVIYDTAKMTRKQIFGSADSPRMNPNYITGSQTGVMLGLSPYPDTTMITLWEEKTRKREIVEKTGEQLEAGHTWENGVAHQFAAKLVEDYGDTLASVDIIYDTNMYHSLIYPWIIFEPDRFAILTFKNGQIHLVGLECKIKFNPVSHDIQMWKDLSFPAPTFYAPSGETSCPPHYDAQCRQMLMGTGLDAWYICCCTNFSRSGCCIALIQPDDEISALIDKKAKEFIQCCLNNEMPVADYETVNSITEMLHKKYDLSNEDRIETDESYSSLLSDAKLLAAKKKDLKRLEKEIEEDEVKLAKALVEKSGGKGTYYHGITDNENIGISLRIPHFLNSIDIDGIKKHEPAIYEQMKLIGAEKVTKSDLEKIEINGKKFDASPYIIEGGINATKPIGISKVTVKALLN